MFFLIISSDILLNKSNWINDLKECLVLALVSGKVTEINFDKLHSDHF